MQNTYKDDNKRIVFIPSWHWVL